jgi:CheY-like chemotaxis protein
MIFVLEDDPERLDWFKSQWTDVVHTDSPIEGMKLLSELSDLEGIYLDHDLGGAPYVRGADGDGIDLARAMAAQKLHANTPIIIHSLNYAGARQMEYALQVTHTDIHRIPFHQLREIRRSWQHPD